MFQWLRIKTVMPHIRGRLLDIGCGNNKLVKKYGNGIGCEKNEGVPLKNKYDTITLVASLNYMTEDEQNWWGLHFKDYLKEDGQIIITCRNVFRGFPKERVEGAFKDGGFYLAFYRPFMFGLNGLYIFRRRV